MTDRRRATGRSTLRALSLFATTACLAGAALPALAADELTLYTTREPG
jgi:hypothetical protein